jgi:hypothetical protein
MKLGRACNYKYFFAKSSILCKRGKNTVFHQDVLIMAAFYFGVLTDAASMQSVQSITQNEKLITYGKMKGTESHFTPVYRMFNLKVDHILI